MAPPSFADATAVKQLSSHTYGVQLDNDWCIGSVPHGGYVTSCFQRVAELHFSTTLQQQNQPHCMTLHMEFPKRTERGPAVFTVKDVKRGRQTSLVHIVLQQHGKEEVLCYINQSNLSLESGISFPTDWTLQPPSTPLPDFAALASRNNDAHWIEPPQMPYLDFRRATARVRFFFPRAGQPSASIVDQWLKFADGNSRFTNASLGYVSDMFLMVVESYREEDNRYTTASSSTSSDTGAGKQKNKKKNKKKPIGAKFWYPTVTLNLDIKKALPEEGVEWLFSRVRSKSIQKGRLDIEVIIMDAEGDLVALSHHVSLVLDASRNLAARRKGAQQQGGESKI